MLTVDNIIEKLTPVFKNYNVKKAILFGSYAKNSATESSDIDLLVDSGLRGLKFCGFAFELQEAAGVDIDVFDTTHIIKNSKIEKEIAQTGKIIYGQ